MSAPAMDSEDSAAAAVESEIDPIWTSSRTARQIYALGEVEKDISRLLSLAASSISLLALPQTDDAERPLPQGEERSEQFVLEVSEYFERLESIQHGMRSTLAHIRQARVAPSAINAPAMGTVPPALGVGLPSIDTEAARRTRGLQEERVERDAWTGIADALRRLKTANDAEAAADDAMAIEDE